MKTFIRVTRRLLTNLLSDSERLTYQSAFRLIDLEDLIYLKGLSGRPSFSTAYLLSRLRSRCPSGAKWICAECTESTSRHAHNTRRDGEQKIKNKKKENTHTHTHTQHTHTHTHTHTELYIHIYVLCVCVCMCVKVKKNEYIDFLKFGNKSCYLQERHLRRISPHRFLYFR